MRRARSVLMLLPLALAACAPAGRPPRPLAQEAPAPASRACLPRAFRDAALVAFSTRGDGARLCLADGEEAAAGHACLLLDRYGRPVGEDAWAPPADTPSRPEEHTITPAGQGYTVCTLRTKRCTTFPVAHPLYESLHEASIVSADGSLAFILYARPTPPAQRAAIGTPEIVGELYETHGGRLLGSVRITEVLGGGGFGDRDITHAISFLGRQVLIATLPAGPGGTTAIVDPATGKGLPLHGFLGEYMLLDEHTLLVLDNRDLSIVDLRTLTVVKRFEVPGVTFDSAERSSSWLARVGGGVLVAYAQPAGAVVFDAATRRLGPPRPLPICRD
jgi:hypothetical protein